MADPLDFSQQADLVSAQPAPPKGPADFSDLADPVEPERGFMGRTLSGLAKNTANLGKEMYQSSARYTQAAEADLKQDIAAPLTDEGPFGIRIRDEPVAKALRWAKTALDVGNVPFQALVGAAVPITAPPLGTIASLPDIIRQPAGIDVPEEIRQRGEDLTQQIAMLPMLADGAGLLGKAESLATDAGKGVKTAIKGAPPVQQDAHMDAFIKHSDEQQAILSRAFDETQTIDALHRAVPREPEIAAKLQEGRANGATVSDDAYFETAEHDPTQFSAQMDAATQLPGAEGAEAAKPDIHQVAADLDPQLIAKRDDLETRIGTYRRWLDELDEQRRTEAPDHPEAREAQQRIDTILGKVNGVESKLTKTAADRLATARADLEERLRPTTDSPDMAHVRARLLADLQDRASLGPEINALYRRAEAKVAGLPEPEAAAPAAEPVEVKGAEASPEAAAPEMPKVASPEAEPTPPKFDIASDWAERLIKGGVDPEVAKAHGELMAARYETRAQTFEGKRGTAAQMYLRDAPLIRKAKTAARAREPEMAQTLEQGASQGPVFYSTLQRGIETKGPNKAPGDQWSNLIRNMGVKAEELDWSGVMDFLKGKKSVTKEELLEHLRENEVQVKEVTHGVARDDVKPDAEAQAKHGDEYKRLGLEINDLILHELQTDTPTTSDAMAQIKALEHIQNSLHDRMVTETMERQGLSGKGPKYASYKLPGGQNYRELLMTLPHEGGMYTAEQGARRAREFLGEDEWNALTDTQRAEYTQAGIEQLVRDQGFPGAVYRSSHRDEPNILAHIRMDDRTGPNGEKILHVAEVQSDWHQAGRRQGYTGQPQTVYRWRNSRSGNAGPWFDTQAEADAFRATLPESLQRDLQAESRDIPQKGVPNAPFKTTWHELAMKRVLRYAAEHDYDKIAWDTGQTQGERYGLAQHISEIRLQKRPNGGARFIALDHDGNSVFDEVVPSRERVAELVGEETANKLFEKEPNDEGEHVLEGQDLTVGGEGMKGFYDKILPNFMNKYVKKWGAKVEPGSISTQEGGLPTGARGQAAVHMVDVTPQMRESAMQGQPLFQQARGQIQLRPGDTRNVITFFKDKHDASTVLHETAHHWLEEFREDAGHELAPDRLKADYETLTKWMGGEPDASTPAGIRRHEKFARAFERYVMEGIAPSKELVSVFERFRNWLVQIYQRASRLRVNLTPEVRQVFDRMLATNPEHAIIAPERPTSATMADIHRVDAESALPHHAGETADLVRSEIDEAARREVPDVHEALTRVGAEESGDEAPGESAEGKPAAGGEPGSEPAAGAAGETQEPTGIPAGGDEPAPEGGGLGGEPEAAGGPSPANDIAGVNERTAGGAGPGLIDKAGNIRLDNLNRPDDVDDCLRQIAAEQNDFADARYGDEGKQLHATIVAARTMMAQAMDHMSEMRTRAAADDATEADLLAYKESANRLTMLANRVATLTHSWGYAGSAFRRLGGLPDLGASMTMAELAARTRNMTLFQLKQEAQLGSKLPTPRQQSRFLTQARMSWWQGARPMIIELYINNLISGPITHMAYTIGNAYLAVQKAAIETPAAAMFSSIHALRGGEFEPGERVYLREVPAQFTGLWRGAADAFSAAGKAFKTGTAELLPPELAALSPEEQAAFIGRGRAEGAIPGRIGRAIRLPSDSVAAIHSFGRAMGYSQEIWRLATRAGLDQGLDGQALGNFVAKYLENPPIETQQKAAVEATRMVLMERAPYGSWTQKLQSISNSNIIAKIIFPFVQIGSNLVKEGLIERTPLGFLHPEVRANLLGENGPEAAAIQRGKVTVGTTVALAVTGLTTSGVISGGGPSDKNHRREMLASGWQPYSIRIGDTWVPYRKFLGPMGLLVAGVADMSEIGFNLNHEKQSHAALSAVLGLGEVIADESWFRGVSQFVDAARNYDTVIGERYFRNLATNFIPYSVGLSQIARMVDDHARVVNSLMDSVRAHIPFGTYDMLPRRDIFGQPVASRVAISPSTQSRDPVYAAMENARFYPSAIGHDIRGVKLSDKQYDTLSQLAGNYLHMRLTNLINSPGWTSVPPDRQNEIMHKLMIGARKQAKSAIIAQTMGTPDDILRQAGENKRKAVGAR